MCVYIYVNKYIYIHKYIYGPAFQPPPTIPHPHHTTGEGRGTVLWLTHDHGLGWWNAGPYI